MAPRLKRRAPKRKRKGGFSLSRTLSGVGGSLGKMIGGRKLGKFIKRGSRKFYNAASYLPQFTIPRMLGMGAYKIKSNSIVKPSGSSQVPFMHLDAKGGTLRVKHREWVCDVRIPANTAGAFIPRLAWLRLNPANSATFPWLSNLAKLYDEWRPLGIAFQFRTNCTDTMVATNGNLSLGSLMIMTDYNSNNKLPDKKVQWDNSEYTVQGKVSGDLIHAVECHPSQTVLPHLYTSDGSSGDSTVQKDRRFASLGMTYVGGYGFQNTSEFVAGEIWVTYDIILQKPTGTFMKGTMDQYDIDAASCTNSDMFAYASATKTSGSNIQTRLGANRIYFPQGQSCGYLISISYRGTSSGWSYPALSYSDSVSAYNLFENHTDDAPDPSASTVGVAQNMTFAVQVDQSGFDDLDPYVQFDSVGILANPTYADLIITTIPTGFT